MVVRFDCELGGESGKNDLKSLDGVPKDKMMPDKGR